jgi:hypothetical protein
MTEKRSNLQKRKATIGEKGAGQSSHHPFKEAGDGGLLLEISLVLYF